MIKVVILGAGNVATQLFNAFFNSEKTLVVQVYNRSQPNLEYFGTKTSTTTSLEHLAEADIYILALKDDAIIEIAPKLGHLKGLVVHTSGSVALNVLKNCKRNGVFYPLQTFSKSKNVDFSNVPLCLETKEADDFLILKNLAASISEKVFSISSDQRKSLHVAAVFACNFVNHLYALGEDICKQNGMSFEMLKPLIKETAQKVTEIGPIDAQTGPALRHDHTTIDKHLVSLNHSNEREIYSLLTKSIQEFHGKKL